MSWKRFMKQKTHTPIVWGKIAAIVMASAVTLACVAQSVDPVVILKRVAIASLVVGAICAALIQCMYHLTNLSR